MKRFSAERVFARLVRVLPRDFFAEYGPDMTATFARRAASARARGRLRLLVFLLGEMAGLVRVVVLEHATALSARVPLLVSPTPSAERKALSPMEHLLREARQAARRLARTPGFTAASVFTLALTLGANTAIFTLLHKVVLSPLPYPAAERLIALEHGVPGLGIPSGVGPSIGLYREYAELPSVEAIAIYATDEMTLSGGRNAERLELLRATPSLGGILGAQPYLGRWFAEAEGEAGAPRVVVLTHGLWTRLFGASGAALGSMIHLDGNAYEVIGVMPSDFVFPDERAQLILPLRLDLADAGFGGFNYQGVARLRPGVGAEDARGHLDAVIADLPARFPENPALVQTVVHEGQLRSLAEPFKEHVLGDITRTLWVLFGSVVIVLLMAGANLANLFLVRVDAREREVAVRRALGAGRTNVATNFLAETLLVTLVSGVLGLWLAYSAVQVLVLNGPVELPRLHEVRIDVVVVGFTALASLLAGLGFSLVPLMRPMPGVASVLQDTGRGNTAGRRRTRGRQLLMGAQISLAVLLLVAAGLMVQSFYRLQDVDPGFRADSRLVFRIGLPKTVYGTRETAAAFNEHLLERLRGLPGVRQAAFTTMLPLEGEGSGAASSGAWVSPLEVYGRRSQQPARNPVVRSGRVSADYFATMSIALRKGRLFDVRDVRGSTNAVLVNEALAGLYFPGVDATGKRIRLPGMEEDDAWFTVVGIVGNTATSSLREAVSKAKMYLPPRSNLSSGTAPELTSATPSTHQATFVLHTSGNPIVLVPAVRQVLEELDSNVALARPERLADVVAQASARLAFTMMLLVLAATVALLLGLVGVYAVISYGVAQREGEIGVRLALGARPGDVTRMILRQSGGVIAVGVLLGVAAAGASMHLLRTLLFGVAWNDPLTYAGVATGLFGVATLACWLPANRAARLDPLDSLRS